MVSWLAWWAGSKFAGLFGSASVSVFSASAAIAGFIHGRTERPAAEPVFFRNSRRLTLEPVLMGVPPRHSSCDV